jgi:hypothetical protein
LICPVICNIIAIYNPGRDMKNFARLIGIAVSAAVKSAVLKSSNTPIKKIAGFALIFVVTGGSAFVVSKGIRFRQVEDTLIQLKKAPLIRVILQDNPQAETELREAVRTGLDTGASDRSREMLGQLRRKYAVSATLVRLRRQLSRPGPRKLRSCATSR